jgi:predicted nucleic acid-binding protein
MIARAAEIARETGAIIYDMLFLALAEDTQTVMVTADDKLLKTLKDTEYSSLARSMREIGSLTR